MLNNLYILGILEIIIIIGIIFYFNKIEEFTTIYGQGLNYKGIYGINCSQCPDGEETSDNLTSCQHCSRTHAGTGGTCEQCPDGTKPTGGHIGYWTKTGGTNCIICPGNTAGTGGRCNMFCGGGYMPNPEKTRCIDDPNWGRRREEEVEEDEE